MQQTIDVRKQYRFTAQIRGLVAWFNARDLEVLLLPVDDEPTMNRHLWEKL